MDGEELMTNSDKSPKTGQQKQGKEEEEIRPREGKEELTNFGY